VRTCLKVLCIAVMFLGACGGDDGPENDAASSQDSTNTSAAELEGLTIGVYPGAFHSLVQHVALQTGIFEDHGLDVEFIDTPSGPEAIAALASKSIDVMINSPGNQMLANAAGQDIVGIVGGLNKSFYTWVAQDDWPTPNAGSEYPDPMEDLRGARIGVTARGAETELFTRQFLIDAGLDPDKDVTWVGVGIGAQAIGAFKADQIDVLVAVEPSQTLLVDDEEIGKPMLDLRKGEGPERFDSWPALTWQGLRSEVEADPERFTRFQEAMADAFDFMHDAANEDQVLDTYSEVLDLDRSVLAKIYDNNLDTIGPDFDCDAYENVVGFMVDSAQLTDEQAQPCEELMWTGAQPYIQNYPG
jgi:NitT/TauT family transport system substrate-binding protein